MQAQNSQRTASIVMVLAAAMWGVYWLPLVYLEGQGLSGIFAATVLNLVPGVLLVGYAFARWPRDRNAIFVALGVGGIAGIGFGLYSAGIVYGSVVRAALLFYLTPIWSTIIGGIWLSERITWIRWLAIAVGLSGLALLVSNGDSAGFSTGDVFALISGLMWAIAASFIKLKPSLPLAGLTGAQFMMTAILTLALGLLFGDQLPVVADIISVMPFVVLLSVGLLIPSVIAIFWAQQRLFPGRAGLLMMSEVLVAVLSASFILPDEHLSPLQWAGAVLIIGTFLLETLGNQRAAVEAV